MSGCPHESGFTFDGVGLACNGCGKDSHDVERELTALHLLQSTHEPESEDDRR